MKIKSGVRRIALAAGGAGVLAGMAIAVPGIASASTAVIGAGHIELCANGNYTAQMDFEGTHQRWRHAQGDVYQQGPPGDLPGIQRSQFLANRNHTRFFQYSSRSEFPHRGFSGPARWTRPTD